MHNFKLFVSVFNKLFNLLLILDLFKYSFYYHFTLIIRIF